MTEAVEIVVVGTGPSAVSVSVPMIEAGQRILMLEAGSAPSEPASGRPSLATIRQRPGHRPSAFGGDLDASTLSADASPKLRAVGLADDVSVYPDATGLIVRNFKAIGLLAHGGLSTLWGAVCPAFDERDLSSFPLTVSDLTPSYRAVAGRIGISGVDNDVMATTQGLDLPLLPPLPLSTNASAILARYERLSGKTPVQVGRPRLAVLTEELAGRRKCDLNGGCLWGCPSGALYSSLVDARALVASGRLELRLDTLVEGVARHDGKWRLDLRGRSGERSQLDANKVVLACGTLSSTRLALAALDGAVGEVKLQSTPALAFALLRPNALGSALPARGTGLAQLVMKVPLDQDGGDYAFGQIHDGAFMPAPDLLHRMPFTTRGGEILLRALLPTIVVGLVYFAGRYTNHRARLTTDERGRRRLVIFGAYDPAVGSAVKVAKRRLSEAFRLSGCFLLPGSAHLYGPGAEAHYGASLPMGERTSRFGEVLGAPGLYVVDGSVLTTLPAKHPTFTIMANADRIGRHIVG